MGNNAIPALACSRNPGPNPPTGHLSCGKPSRSQAVLGEAASHEVSYRTFFE